MLERSRFAAIFAQSLITPPASAAPADDWSSYNLTLTSQRFAPHDQITRENVKGLKVVCSYDTGLVTSFQTGPLVVAGALYGTTEMDTFAIDAASCKQRWRVHERIADPKPGESVPAAPIAWEGLVFGGNAGGDNDGVKGRMYALEAATGKIAWEFHLVPREHPTQEPAKATARGPAAKQAASWGNATAPTTNWWRRTSPCSGSTRLDAPGDRR